MVAASMSSSTAEAMDSDTIALRPTPKSPLRRRIMHCDVTKLMLLVALAGCAIALVTRCPAAPPILNVAANHVTAHVGAVAADHATCSSMGVERLRAGGNAVDAAVTTALCLGVVRPFSSGLGGGAFILIHLANGTSLAIDAREAAPASATESMYVGRPKDALLGGAAIAIPAELQGLRAAWERHGRLPWAEVVRPAAELAESFEVDAELAEAIEASKDELRAFSASARLLLPGGRPPRVGERLHNPALAATLRALATDPTALSRGALAAKLVDEIAAAGGNFSMRDLSDYAPVLREPLKLKVDGMTLLGVPPPSSGGATILMAMLYLSLLQTPVAAASRALAAHLQVEALKHAFALRMSLGDPAFVPSAVEAVGAMLSPAFSRQLSSNASDATTRPLREYGGRVNLLPSGLPTDSGTSHLSVVDADRNAVSLTTTINVQPVGSEQRVQCIIPIDHPHHMLRECDP